MNLQQVREAMKYEAAVSNIIEGVDAFSRRHLWSVLKARSRGKIVLLTTHFMDEADILADR